MAETATAENQQTEEQQQPQGGIKLPDDIIRQLIEAGVHFGHRSSRWNPKMARYIFAKRNHIHIIDLKQTVRGLLRAMNFLEKVAASGGEVLVVGTKRQAQEAVREVAVGSGMNFVTERWLGGTLTNNPTIRHRLKRLDELEELERSGVLAKYSKKMQVRLKREHDKIFRNLEGIRYMESLPTALIIVDARREQIALKEAAKLKIPTISLIDTDSSPDLVDIPIPGNDDATRSIRLLLGFLGDAVERGRKVYKTRVAARLKEQQEAARQAKQAEKPKPAEAPQLGIQRKVIQPVGGGEAPSEATETAEASEGGQS